MSTDRLVKLNGFFHAVLSGKRNLRTSQNGELFIEALCSQPEAVACVEKVILRDHGLPAISKCVRFSVSTEFQNQHASNLLVYLSSPDVKNLVGGEYLRKIVLAIADPPTFWLSFVQSFKAGNLNDKAQEGFVWLLLQLISLPPGSIEDNIVEGFRDVAKDTTVQKRINDSPVREARDYGYKINNILATLAGPTDAVREDFGPGGRHDNDFVEIPKIAILPTADELTSTEMPYFRTASTVENAGDDVRSIVHAHIDNQFRLLREDMIGEIRDELQLALKIKKGGRGPRGFILSGLTAEGIDCGADKRREAWGLRLKHRGPLTGMGSLKNEKARQKYLIDHKGVFKHQSIACILVDGSPVAFPTIHRDEGLLARDEAIVILRFEDANVLANALLKIKCSQDVKLVQINTSVFAYEPILNRLKVITELSLADELFLWKTGSKVADAKSSVLLQILEKKLATAAPTSDLATILRTDKPVRLDDSQLKCFLSGIKQRVSLIQGPPGTGKSFVGALITKALCEMSAKTILVVCYTNHALDQFLEDLMDIGIPMTYMVRLGGKSTPRTKPLSLFEMRDELKTSREAWRKIDKLKGQMTELEDRLKTAFHAYRFSKIQQSQLLEYLEFSIEGPPFFFDAFQVPNEADGMKVIGNKGREVSAYYLLDRWTMGQNAGVFQKYAVFKNHKDVWEIPHETRKRLRAEWERDILSERVTEFANMVKLYNQYYSQNELLRSEKFLDIVKSKRIIGCTTTAAAKYSRELQAANPQAIIVEEAGEILESHIITALGQATDQLVLIGDHKQLRPKIANYKLSVEKGEGYNLNVSLFERLVLKGFPHTVLSQQHRMRPEISALVRALTYPALVDAPKTKDRDNIQGLQKNVVFLTHNHAELDAKELHDRKDVNTTASKQNKFEVELVLKCVKYLGQQGYGTDDIVVLTPYLGQLQLLRKMLSKDNDPVLNDLDSFDLVQAGIIPEETAKLTKKPIYISTIDNYQGEERKIVLATLTRSNESCEIGFMSAHERLNVLISRARDGLIMIGNADTFKGSRKGKETWTPFFELLEKDGNIFGGLPVKCERHPQRKAILKTPLDFEEECPDGGCLEPCGTLLSCKQHNCPSKCHQISDHSKMKCAVIIPGKCSVGHDQSRKCHETQPKSCKKCDQEAEHQRKAAQEAMDRQLKRERDQKEHDRQMAIINDEIKAQQEIVRDRNEAEQRSKALAMKRNDLDNATRQAKAASVRATTASQMQNSPINAPKPQSIPVATAQVQSGGVVPLSSSTQWKVTGNVSPAPEPQPAGGPPAAGPSKPAPEIKADAVPVVLDEIPKSASMANWERQKRMDGANNPNIDKLMEMIGLEKVKKQILNIKSKIETAKRQNTDLKDERFHVSLLGNPGTGKTTVARLYAKVLVSLEVLDSQNFVETTGSRLSNDGVPGARKLVDGLVNDGGGVILIDEAYQLVESGSVGGKQVLDFLLAEMENQRDKLVFILTGYNKEMEKFFEHNPGLQSRVPHSLQFEDYSDLELRMMFKHKVYKKFKGAMKIEGGGDGLYVRIAIKRLGRGRNTPGFGNARALENLFSKITTRQAERLAASREEGNLSDDFVLTKEDLIGPDPSKAAFESTAWKELQSLIGLEDVKEAVKSLVARVKTNYDRELLEKEILQFTPNKVFLGNPGTGKTTVAKVYGQILKDIGMLSNGEVIVKNPSDFIGSALGQSESQTKGILSSTVGKVLIIDEAYMLHSKAGAGIVGGGGDIYRTAVIDTIVAEVQNVPGDDRCVLLAGYRAQMEEMYQNINPGFKRRFPLEEAFDFKDYDDDDLRKIMDLNLRKGSLEATKEAKDVAIDILSRSRNRPNFGNAGELKNLLSKASQNMNARCSSGRSSDDTLIPEDFDKDYNRGEDAALNTDKLFEDVIGCENIVAKLKGYQQVAKSMKKKGMDFTKYIPTTFVFKGPPGTGKTTTANKMGQVFYNMGFLSSADVVECSASDMIAGFVGQTALKTKEVVTKALGRVLFIDEAYRLSDPGQFTKEAIDELVDILTKPAFLGKVIVILAGYDNDMDRLMSVNAGLASRFAEEIVFKHLSAEHCMQVMYAHFSKNSIGVPQDLLPGSSHYTQMLQLVEKMSKISGWGNARDIKKIANEVVRSVHLKASEGDLEVTPDMLITAAKTFYNTQKSRQRQQQKRATFPLDPSLWRDQPVADAPPPTFSQPAITTETKLKSQDPEPEPVPEAEESLDQRDPGVSDETWAQLQIDKKSMERAEAKRKGLAQELKDFEKKSVELEKKEQKLMEQQPPNDDEDDEEEERRKKERERLRLERLKALEAEARARKAAEEAERARKHEARMQAKLRSMGVCPVGYQWIKQSSGYRCAGGSHFVTSDQLGV